MMHRTLHVIPPLTVALALLLGTSEPAGAQSRALRDYVVFAGSEFRTRGLQVQRGDVGVNEGALLIRNGFVIAPQSELSGTSVLVPPDATCRQQVTTTAFAAAPGCPAIPSFQSPFAGDDAIAAACGFPMPFPACSTAPERAVTVGPGEDRVLEPGAYGAVVVRGAADSPGRLRLRIGTYTFCSLRTYRGAQIILEGATTLQVAGDIRLATQSLVTPTGIDPETIKLFGAGRVRLSRYSDATATICAPYSTLRINRGVRVVGRLVARTIVAAGLEATLPTTTPTTPPSTSSTSTTSSTTTSSSSSTSTSSTSTSTSFSTSTTTSSSTSSSSTSSTSTSTSSSSSSSSSTSTSSTTSSTTSTVAPRCGDGVVNQASEECDDGNDVDRDCCSNACASAPDDTPCGLGDVCSGDATCREGVCTATSAEQALTCLVPYSGAVITNFDDGTAEVLDLAAGTLGAPASVGRGAWGVAIHPAGEEIWVTAREDDRITILDAATNAVRETLAAGMLPLGIVFDGTGARAYVASFGTDEVLIYDAVSRALSGAVKVGDGPSGLALDPTGRRLYVTNFGSNSISVIDLDTERVVRKIKTKKRPLELALDPVHGRLYVTNFAHDSVSVIGTISESILATVRVGKRPFGVAVDPVRNRAWVTNAVSDTVSVIDGATCTQEVVIDVGDGPLGIGLDLPGTRAIIANSNDASLSILDTVSGTVSSTIDVGATPVAFGGFIGPRANDCPRSPLVCDDANPMTLDSCAAETGCRFEAYPTPAEAAEVGLDALDTTVREAGVDALGGTTRAALLSRLTVDAQTALVAGSGTPTQRIKQADRSVRRFTKVVQKGVRRRKVSCDVGQAILDLSRGIRLQLRQARS